MKNFTYLALIALMSVGLAIGVEYPQQVIVLKEEEKAFINRFAPYVAKLEEDITTRCQHTSWTSWFGESRQCRNAKNSKRDFLLQFGTALKNYHRKKWDDEHIAEYHACNHNLFSHLLLGGKTRCDQAKMIRRYHERRFSQSWHYGEPQFNTDHHMSRHMEQLEVLLKKAAETSEQAKS